MQTNPKKNFLSNFISSLFLLLMGVGFSYALWPSNIDFSVIELQKNKTDVARIENSTDGWVFYLANDSNRYLLEKLLINTIDRERMSKLGGGMEQYEFLYDINSGKPIIYELRFAQETYLSKAAAFKAYQEMKDSYLYMALFSIVFFCGSGLFGMVHSFKQKKRDELYITLTEEGQKLLRAKEQAGLIKIIHVVQCVFPFLAVFLNLFQKAAEKSINVQFMLDMLYHEATLTKFEKYHWAVLGAFVLLSIIGNRYYRSTGKKIQDEDEVARRVTIYYNGHIATMGMYILGMAPMLTSMIFAGNIFLYAVAVAGFFFHLIYYFPVNKKIYG